MRLRLRRQAWGPQGSGQASLHTRQANADCPLASSHAHQHKQGNKGRAGYSNQLAPWRLGRLAAHGSPWRQHNWRLPRPAQRNHRVNSAVKVAHLALSLLLLGLGSRLGLGGLLGSRAQLVAGLDLRVGGCVCVCVCEWNAVDGTMKGEERGGM